MITWTVVSMRCPWWMRIILAATIGSKRLSWKNSSGGIRRLPHHHHSADLSGPVSMWPESWGSCTCWTNNALFELLYKKNKNHHHHHHASQQFQHCHYGYPKSGQSNQYAVPDPKSTIWNLWFGSAAALQDGCSREQLTLNEQRVLRQSRIQYVDVFGGSAEAVNYP